MKGMRVTFHQNPIQYHIRTRSGDSLRGKSSGKHIHYQAQENEDEDGMLVLVPSI
jgi:hypothetical protein